MSTVCAISLIAQHREGMGGGRHLTVLPKVRNWSGTSEGILFSARKINILQKSQWKARRTIRGHYNLNDIFSNEERKFVDTYLSWWTSTKDGCELRPDAAIISDSFLYFGQEKAIFNREKTVDFGKWCRWQPCLITVPIRMKFVIFFCGNKYVNVINSF